MKMVKKLIISMITISLSLVCRVTDGVCDKLLVGNYSIGEYDLSNGHVDVKFDVSWRNSWRSSTGRVGRDAVWIFAKFRKNGGDWEHVRLNGAGAHTVGSAGMTVEVGLEDTSVPFNSSTNPGVGVFIYRSVDGSGVSTANDVTLSWHYAGNGVVPGVDVVDMRILGLEMVYVEEGAFYAGDNATSSASFKQGSSDNDPWHITSEGAISVSNVASNGYYYVTDSYSNDDATGSAFTIPSTYPKGYGGFYVMKTELTQAHWVDFFNMLSSSQKANRDITSSTNGGKNSDSIVYRNNVSWTGSGNATLPGNTHKGVSVNYLSWGDLTAYLDWSGLRPMSELEYEKACRGPLLPVSGEYAWGSTTIVQATGILNSGLANERGSPLNSNIAYNNSGGVQGPVRTGSFGVGASGRVSAGTSYSAAYDLSGNLWERAVTVGNSTGRSFNGGKHGNGVLLSDGNPDVSTWPSTTAVGAGFRGGDWDSDAAYARVSDRGVSAYVSSSRTDDYGGRGVRSVPPAGG